MSTDLSSDKNLLRVAMFRGRGILSALIRWQTWSSYSHAAIVLPDGYIVEAWHRGPGVRRKLLKSTKGVDVFNVKGLTEEQSAVAEKFAMDQIGQKYDYFGVLRFLNRRKVGDNGKWFCSELVYAAFKAAGVHLLSKDTQPNMVSPGLLSRSPLLFSENNV